MLVQIRSPCSPDNHGFLPGSRAGTKTINGHCLAMAIVAVDLRGSHIAGGDGLSSRSQQADESIYHVSTEPFEPNPQPGVAERALDTATDMSRSLGEMVGTLRTAVDRLNQTMTEARRPGTALSAISTITREAPLASLFVAFLFGIAVARRR